jgi:polyferredoxin
LAVVLIVSMFNLHLITGAFGLLNKESGTIKNFFLILVVLTVIYQFVWTTYVRRYFLPALLPLMVWSFLGVKEISRTIKERFKLPEQYVVFGLSFLIVFANIVATYLTYSGPQ